MGHDMKICACIFSTNRIPYLTRTLESQKLLDFTGCEVHKILFDDYPKGRNDMALIELASAHGYNEMRLHGENLSIGATWREFWDLIRNRDYDFVWHQEDDAVILEPVNVMNLISMIRPAGDSQIVLQRQPWYHHEKPCSANPGDYVHGEFRGEFNESKYYFTPICSLYPISRVRFDYWKWYAENYPHEPIWQNTNPNEAFVGKALLESQRLMSLHIKNREGKNLVEHIGEYCQGRRLLQGEPGYETFAKYDPEKQYYSATGKPYLLAVSQA